MKIYVRISQDGYEGQSLRFVTTDEEYALNHFDTNGDNYARDWNGEDRTEYGVLKIGQE